MKSPMFRETAPTERHKVCGRDIIVYRADLVPLPPLAPYLKMIELYPFLKLIASRGYKAFGYYAVPESEWVESVPTLADSLRMKAIIGMSKTKKMPAYSERIRDHLYLLSPNIYSVNFSRTRKYVESVGGFMAPMGLACQEVVDGMREFLDRSPLAVADTYVVPVGSGVALSGVLNHLRGRGLVYGISTRPVASVARVVSEYARYSNYQLRYRASDQEVLETQPFPMHRFWDWSAFLWMKENIRSLEGQLCFVNLGSGGSNDA